MKEAFAFSPIVENGDVEAWLLKPKSLPESYFQNGIKKSTKEWLKDSKTTSFLVVQDGVVTYEEYSLGTKPDDLRISWSLQNHFYLLLLALRCKRV